MGGYALEVMHIRKSFSGKLILDDVDFKVNRGKITSFLGPNGAGKTTTIRIILNLIKQDSGEVVILGRSNRDKEIFKEIGYIQELPNLPSFLTGRQLLKISSRMKGAKEEEIDEYLKIVGLLDHGDKKISKYSKGMIQRLAIAESLIGNPTLLVMDEPNIGTDPLANIFFREMFKDIVRRRGVTIFFSSHDLSEVEKISEEVVIILKGKTFFTGNIEDLISKFLGVRIEVELANPSNEIFECVKNIGYVREFSSQGSLLLVGISEDKRWELLRDVINCGGKVISFKRENDLEKAYVEAIKRGRGY